jgi:hypothetical protein
MRAKAELKSVTASTGHQRRRTTTDHEAVTAARPARETLRGARRRHRALAGVRARRRSHDRLSHHERRAAALTAAFLRAKKIADRLRPASADARVSAEQVAEYRGAVTDYEVAFDLAERDARRVRDSQFSDAERKRLATAQQLLAVALDQSATPAERQVAYRRVREEVDGLLALSDEAVERLETKVALQLERPQPTPNGARPGPRC